MGTTNRRATIQFHIFGGTKHDCFSFSLLPVTNQRQWTRWPGSCAPNKGVVPQLVQIFDNFGILEFISLKKLSPDKSSKRPTDVCPLVKTSVLITVIKIWLKVTTRDESTFCLTCNQDNLSIDIFPFWCYELSKKIEHSQPPTTENFTKQPKQLRYSLRHRHSSVWMNPQ